jgi:hypothetical protein
LTVSTHRTVPANYADEGLRVLSGNSSIYPEGLAESLPPSQLGDKAYTLYEKFRPEIPPGKKGWGISGKLDVDLIRKMASA